MMTTQVDGLTVTIEDGVALVTLDRADAMNALTQPMIVGLWDIFCELDTDDDVRAIVVTGAGRVFCAGIDLSGGESGAFSDEPVVYRHKPWQLRTPVIGAINGSAVGLGLTLACQWDIRVVAADAKLGFVFARRGVVTEAVSGWIVPRLIGMAPSLELMLTGRHFDGDEAVRLGLATKALPRAEVLPAALELARDIAVNTSPASVGAIKGLLWQSLREPSIDRAGELDAEVYAWARRLPDPAEGIAAFLERRPPRWQTSKTGDYPDALGARSADTA